jgi:hypothetical protein
LPFGIVVGVGIWDCGRTPPLPSGITTGAATGVGVAAAFVVAGVGVEAAAMVRLARGGELVNFERVANGLTSTTTADLISSAVVCDPLNMSQKRGGIRYITLVSSDGDEVGKVGTTSVVTPSSRTKTILAALFFAQANQILIVSIQQQIR